jgi:hypothetical protein
MAIEAGDPQRVLGDYVSKQKMQTDKESCAKTHGGLPLFDVPCARLKLFCSFTEELSRRLSEAEVAVRKLREGADSVRSTDNGCAGDIVCYRLSTVLTNYVSSRISDEAASCSRRSRPTG